MITLEKITIYYFGSIKELVYEFDKPGINLIKGENGVGKTTIFNALSWCIYKKLIKPGCSVDPWPHTLDKNYQGTMVSVNFRNEKHSYQITRCKDYKGKVGNPKQKGGNGLFLFKDGQRQKEKYKNNIQPKIEKVIGYSFNLFKNAILFGQEVERLMKETGPNKRKVFEDAFDASFIEEAKQKVIVRLQKAQAEQDRLHNKHKLYESQLEQFDAVTEKLLTQNKDSISRYREDKREVIKYIKFLRQWVKQNNQYIEEINLLNQRLKNLESKVDPNLRDEEFKLNMWINGKQQEFETVWGDIKETLQDYRKALTCSKCKRPLEKKDLKKHKQSCSKKLKELKTKSKVLSKELESLKSQYSKVKEGLTKQAYYIKKIAKFKTKLNSLNHIKEEWSTKNALIANKREQELPRLKNYIQTLKKEQRVLKQERLEEKEKIQKKADEYREKTQVIDKKVEIDKWLINDPLSNTGIRSYIIDAMIQDINVNLKNYKQHIGFGIKVYIDLKSARKDIGISMTKKGDEVPYEDLSKGQKQLTDVALAFAINDTITKAKPINILLIDELFESLSKNNVEVVGNIVLQKAQNTSIHLITHHAGFQPSGAKKLTLSIDKQGHTITAA